MQRESGQRKERTDESSIKYQIQVPSVFPAIDPDRENHNDQIKTMTNFYPSILQSSEINKSDHLLKKNSETPTRSADSSKLFKLNVQNTIVSLDKFSLQSRPSELNVKIPLPHNQKILPDLNRKSSIQSTIENETIFYNKKQEYNEYKCEVAKSLKNMQKMNSKMDPQMPYIGQFYPEKSVKKINQFNSFKRYSQNHIYSQNNIDRNPSSLNVQNIKFNEERMSQNLSEILQLGNPIQQLKVRKSNQLNNLDSSIENSKLNENNYDNLEIKQNRHKLTKSIDDNKQLEHVFQDSLKQQKLFQFNEKKGLLELKNKNIYQKNMMLINLRKKSDKYQLGIPSHNKKYETISQEVQLEGESLRSIHRLNQDQSRFKNEYLNYDSKLQLSTDELFNIKEMPKSILVSEDDKKQMLIQENKQDQKNDEMIANFVNFQIKPVHSNSVEQSFFSVATNRQKTSDRQERSKLESPKNKLKFDGKFLDLEKKRIDISLKNLDSVQIDIDKKMKELSYIDEKSLLDIPFSLLNAIGGTLERVVFAQEQGKQQIYSKQFSNLILQLISDLQNSKKVFSTCINQLNLKKDKNIQNKENVIETQNYQIEQLQQRLINEDKILNSERQKEVRKEINEYLLDQNIMDAKLGGVFNKLNKVNDEKEQESKKKNRTYQDLQDLLQLAMYSGANKEMIEILQQQHTILEIEKKNGELVQIADFDRNLLDDDNSTTLQNELNRMMLSKAKNVQKGTSKILVKTLVKNIQQKDNFTQTLNNDQQVIKDLEIMCGDYIKKYEMLKLEQSGYKKIIDQLTAKNNSMKNVERGLKDQIKSLNLKVEELKLNIIQEQEKYGNALDLIEEQKKLQKIQFEQNYQKNLQLHERVQYQESVIKTYKEQKKVIEDQIQQLNQELEEKQNTFQNLLNEKDENIQELNIEIQERDLKHSQIVQDIENLKTELQKQIDEKNIIQQNLEEYMKQRKKETSESEEKEDEQNQNQNVESIKSGQILIKKKKKKQLNIPVKNTDAKSSIPKSNEIVNLSESLGSFLKLKRENQENSDKLNSSSIRQIASQTSNLVFDDKKQKDLNSISFEKTKKNFLNQSFNQSGHLQSQITGQNLDSQRFDYNDNKTEKNNDSIQNELINIQKQEFNLDLLNFNENKHQYYLQLSQKNVSSTEENIKRFQENRVGTKIEVHQREMRNGKYVMVPQTKQEMKDFFVKGDKVQNTIDTLRQFQNDVQQRSHDILFFSQSSQTDIDTMTFLKILNLVRKTQQAVNITNDTISIQKQPSLINKNKQDKKIKMHFGQQVNKQIIKKEMQLFEKELKNQACLYAQNSSFTKHSVLEVKQIKDSQTITEKEMMDTGRQTILLLKNNDKSNKGQQADTTDDKIDNFDSISIEEEQHQIPFVNSYSQNKIYDQIFTSVDNDGSLYQNSRLEVIQEDKSSKNVRHIVSLVHQNNQGIGTSQNDYQNEKFNLKDEDYALQKLDYTLSNSKSLASARKDQAQIANQNQINFNINFNNYQSFQIKNSNYTPESQKVVKFNQSLSPSFLLAKHKYSSIQSQKNQSQIDLKLHKILPISIHKFKNSIDQKQVFQQQNYNQVKSQILSINSVPDKNLKKKKKLNKDFEELEIIYSEQQLAQHIIGLEEEQQLIDNQKDKLKFQKSSSVKSNQKQISKLFQAQNSKLASFQYKWPPQIIKKAVGGGTNKSANSLTCFE